MGGVDVHRLLRGIPLNHTAAQGPVKGPVLVAHSMADLELARAIRQERVDGARHLIEVVGMNPLEPRLRRVTNLVLLASDEAEPLWGKMDPVRGKVPAPECLALRADAEEV